MVRQGCRGCTPTAVLGGPMVQWVGNQLWDKDVMLAYIRQYPVGAGSSTFMGYTADGWFICQGQWKADVKSLVARHCFSNPEEE